MATIRIPEEIWRTARQHLFGDAGEHFAFFLARWTYSLGEPVFMVRDVLLLPDDQLTANWDGMELSLDGILQALNAAVRSGDCLIEAHNHGGDLPRFSITDRHGLSEFPRYVLESLPERPYAATVWGDTTVYGEYFLPSGEAGQIDSVTVVGSQLRQIVSRDDDLALVGETFDRQLPWFTQEGQRQLGRLRVAIVGVGGNGSPVIQNLVYQGCRDFVEIDDDVADETSLNRLITATTEDVDTAKTALGSRLIKSVAPNAHILAITAPLQTHESLDALKGVDIIFGCVDNDGARLILNELALAYRIPYIDVASGITIENGKVTQAGGRVALVLPGGPCLHCMGEIDPEEAGYFLAPPEERAERLARGYVTGMKVKAPAVGALNAVVAAAAVTEFGIYVSGVRLFNIYTDYDTLGRGRGTKGQWLTPRQVQANPGCVQCTVAGHGDAVGIERYVWSERQPIG
jgi:molybdopterin/thiamine biosynthesis adenylyltransferase